MKSNSQANITLTLDKELLKEAKVEAAKQNVAVSTLLAEALKIYVLANRDYQFLKKSALSSLNESKVSSGGWNWNRDEIYDSRK